MSCVSCSGPLGPQAVFCGSCGTPVAKVSPQPEPGPPARPQTLLLAPAAGRVTAPSEATISYLAQRQFPLLLLFLLAVFMAGTGYFFYSSHLNKERAESWQARTATLEANTQRLNSLLDTRTGQVNERTKALNFSAEKLSKAQSALRKSEGDVGSLETRQRQLAAEKAKVEDQRALMVVQAANLEIIAETFEVCNTGMLDLLDYVINDNYASANAIAETVFDDCTDAHNGFASYRQQYGD